MTTRLKPLDLRTSPHHPTSAHSAHSAFAVAATEPAAVRRKSRRSATAPIWVGGSPPAELAWVEPILEPTNNAEGGHRHRQHLDRGGGARRRIVPPHRQGLPRPLPARHRRRPSRGDTTSTASRSTRSPSTSTSSTSTACPKDRRVVAALGPQVLKLSAQRSAGAHPVPDDAGAHRRGARADRARRRSSRPSTRWC